MSRELQLTTNHHRIREWAEAREGKPTRLAAGKGEAGSLRIDFVEYGDERRLEQISWDEFFEKFEAQQLAFLYQDETQEGKPSRFSRLVRRDTVERCS